MLVHYYYFSYGCSSQLHKKKIICLRQDKKDTKTIILRCTHPLSKIEPKLIKFVENHINHPNNKEERNKITNGILEQQSDALVSVSYKL